MKQHSAFCIRELINIAQEVTLTVQLTPPKVTSQLQMSTLQYLEASPTKQRVKRKLCLPDERTQISELQFSPPVTDLDKNLHSFTKRQKLSYFAITVPYENVTAELQVCYSNFQDQNKLISIDFKFYDTGPQETGQGE